MDASQNCCLCGRKITSEEPVETLDGYLCSQCMEELSPWFQEFDLAETEELQQQVRLRQQNARALEAFHPTRKFGFHTLVVVDDRSKTFLVTDSRNLRKGNPDLISLDQVLDCNVEVEEDREEIGPRLYRYTYDFQVDIDLDHPYLDHIRFPLLPEPLSYESSEKSFLGFGGFDPEEEEDYRRADAMGMKIEDVLTDLEEEGEDNSPYLVSEGEFTLGEADPGAGESTPAAESSKVCPWCGCRTRVTDSFTCDHCGGPL